MDPQPRGIPSRPLVLVVDDHDDTRELYALSLAAFGFEAIEARDCEHAFRQAQESNPDVVVTDLALGGADGWELIQDLKREARTRDIPVVVLTGHAAPSLRERAEHEGCAAFFVKPCLPDALADELRQLLGRTSLMNAPERLADGDARSIDRRLLDSPTPAGECGAELEAAANDGQRRELDF